MILLVEHHGTDLVGFEGQLAGPAALGMLPADQMAFHQQHAVEFVDLVQVQVNIFRQPASLADPRLERLADFQAFVGIGLR